MKRMGRPPTGRKPNFVVRIDPALANLAREKAKARNILVGLWIEEAIRDKAKREIQTDGD